MGAVVFTGEEVGLSWRGVVAAIAAAGALGTAAFGIVDAFAKFFAWPQRRLGLSYRGYGTIKELIQPFHKALRISYGEDFENIIRQQYRDGRSRGGAPHTIRNGVRLALPFMSESDAHTMISSVWGLDFAKEIARNQIKSDHIEKSINTLVHRITNSEVLNENDDAHDARDDHDAIGLGARFSTALDLRVEAAFALAEQQYTVTLQFAAAVTALTLVCLLNWSPVVGAPLNGSLPWPLAFLVGVAAVPLAPVSKDLAKALNQSVSTWREFTRRAL